MSERRLNRIAAILMIGVILFWNLAPIISYAGTFMKPGTAMSTGQFMTPGKAITGGTFIVPGQVYEPGKVYEIGQVMEAGKIGATSGKPIFPGSPYQTGIFMIPNAPPPPPNNFFWDLRAMEIGNPLQSGASLTGGTHALGGQVGNTGQSLNAGQVGSVGQVRNNGQTPNQGQVGNGGQAPNNGQIGNNGQTPNGGQSGNNGQLLNGNGSEENSGQVPIGGQVGNGNQIVNGNEQQGNKSKPTNGGQVGNDGQVSINYEFLSFLEETGSGAKKYLISYPKRLGEMLDGVLSIQAGFKIKDLKTNLGNRNLYQILGENKAVNGNNPMHKFLNKRYQKYLENFNDNKLILWNGNLRSDDKVKEKKINTFFNSNTKFQTVLKRIGKDFSDNWNPFSNPFNSANKGIGKIINKEFFKLSKIAKGNGLGNVLLSTGGRIIDYASDSKKFFKSTSFAAGITTDVAFGVGTTAVSVGAGWAATAITASAIGSVVPGVGTAVGAAVGLTIGLLLETKRGRRLKSAVERGVKKLYDDALSLSRKLGSNLKSKISGMFG